MEEILIEYGNMLNLLYFYVSNVTNVTKIYIFRLLTLPRLVISYCRFGTKWYTLVHVGTKMVIKWGSMVHNGSNYIKEKH